MQNITPLVVNYKSQAKSGGWLLTSYGYKVLYILQANIN